MNPIITKVATQKVIRFLTSKTVLTIIAIVVVIFILRGGIKKWIRNKNQRAFEKKENTPPAQLAQQYRTAFNPSGVSWLINADGTNEEAIEKLAFQTKGQLDEVARAYKERFDELLTDRLRAELSSDEYQNWINIVS